MRSEGAEHPNWTAVVTYYAIACAISWPFFWWFNMHPESWATSAVPLVVRFMGLMWGPGIAAIVCFRVFRRTHKRTITFWGNSKIRSVSFYLVPMIMLWLTRPSAARVSFGLVEHPERITGTAGPALCAAATLMLFIYPLGEELGWRGFLQDALRPLRFFPRFLTIGILWDL